MQTELLCLRDAYVREFTAAVTAVDGNRVALERTALYPTGGGQPHDTGTLGGARVVDVLRAGDEVRHVLDGEAPGFGAAVEARIGEEIAADRPVRVHLMPRSQALAGEVGGVHVVKTESKGKAHERIRVEVGDA